MNVVESLLDAEMVLSNLERNVMMETDKKAMAAARDVDFIVIGSALLPENPVKNQ